MYSRRQSKTTVKDKIGAIKHGLPTVKWCDNHGKLLMTDKQLSKTIQKSVKYKRNKAAAETKQ